MASWRSWASPFPRQPSPSNMVRHRIPPSHTWRSFLDNHAKDLVSLDFFTLPTATFRVLFVFIVLRHDRRRIVHFNVTEHPSAEWTAQQIGRVLVLFTVGDVYASLCKKSVYAPFIAQRRPRALFWL